MRHGSLRDTPRSSARGPNARAVLPRASYLQCRKDTVVVFCQGSIILRISVMLRATAPAAG